jgi:hypothetical protein
VKRILTIGAALVLGVAVGCTNNDKPANPKPANPQGNPKLKRDAMPGGTPEGAQPKMSGALKD